MRGVHHAAQGTHQSVGAVRGQQHDADQAEQPRTDEGQVEQPQEPAVGNAGRQIGVQGAERLTI